MSTLAMKEITQWQESWLAPEELKKNKPRIDLYPNQPND